MRLCSYLHIPDMKLFKWKSNGTGLVKVLQIFTNLLPNGSFFICGGNYDQK